MSLETNHRLVAGRRHRKSVNRFRPLKIDDLIDSSSTSKNRIRINRLIRLSRRSLSMMQATQLEPEAVLRAKSERDVIAQYVQHGL